LQVPSLKLRGVMPSALNFELATWNLELESW
jgi:hypothetical protein